MKTSIKTTTNSFAYVAAATLIITGSCMTDRAAHAAELSQRLTQSVSYADLNLDSKQGAKTFYARLRQAAEKVCAPLESRDLSMNARWRSCYDTALSSAVADVNKTAVTVLHNTSVARPSKG